MDSHSSPQLKGCIVSSTLCLKCCVFQEIFRNCPIVTYSAFALHWILALSLHNKYLSSKLTGVVGENHSGAFIVVTCSVISRGSVKCNTCDNPEKPVIFIAPFLNHNLVPVCGQDNFPVSVLLHALFSSESLLKLIKSRNI